MDKFEMGMNILSGIASLVHFAESWFSDKPKSGKEKAALVLNGAEDIVNTMEEVTTGGAHNTWQKIEKIMPAVIDTTARILYPPK